MTYETKNITFHVIYVKVSNDSRCSRTLLMNVVRVHIVVVREICARTGLVEDVRKAWSNMIKRKALYQNVILRLSNLFRAKYA